MGAVAKRYAKALFEVAKDKQQLETVEQELALLDQLFAEHPDFLKLLHHPLIDGDTKKKQIETIFADKLSQTMITFLNVLIDRDRENELHDIFDSYVRLANRERGLEDAYVHTVKPLTDAESKRLAEHFGQLTGKTIRIHNRVDPSLIGGVSVKIGDRIYDGSIQGKMNRFKKRVVNV